MKWNRSELSQMDLKRLWMSDSQWTRPWCHYYTQTTIPPPGGRNAEGNQEGFCPATISASKSLRHHNPKSTAQNCMCFCVLSVYYSFFLPFSPYSFSILHNTLTYIARHRQKKTLFLFFFLFFNILIFRLIDEMWEEEKGTRKGTIYNHQHK